MYVYMYICLYTYVSMAGKEGGAARGGSDHKSRSSGAVAGGRRRSFPLAMIFGFQPPIL